MNIANSQSIITFVQMSTLTLCLTTTLKPLSVDAILLAETELQILVVPTTPDNGRDRPNAIGTFSGGVCIFATFQ